METTINLSTFAWSIVAAYAAGMGVVVLILAFCKGAHEKADNATIEDCARLTCACQEDDKGDGA